MQDLGAGLPNVELGFLASQGKDSYLCVSSQFRVSTGRVWVFSLENLSLSASPNHLGAVLLPFMVEALFIQFFSSFHKRIIARAVFDILCP